jgi:hypothetical protein
LETPGFPETLNSRFLVLARTVLCGASNCEELWEKEDLLSLVCVLEAGNEIAFGNEYGIG